MHSALHTTIYSSSRLLIVIILNYLGSKESSQWSIYRTHQWRQGQRDNRLTESEGTSRVRGAAGHPRWPQYRWL